ncbi:MAG: YicC family protein [Deltaproteobacteria bacterium]|nr:YicC family protein [Deltaproteobacteria bacterium]
MKSMTAYGRGEHEADGMRTVVEVRSVNHRYRDVFLRMPRDYQALEEDLKAQVTSRVHRGRVELSIQVDQDGERVFSRLELNEPLVRAYLTIFRELADRYGVDNRVGVDTLCQMKDVIVYRPEEVDLEQAKAGCLAALGAALDSFDAMRRREGEAIASDFRKRLNSIGHYVEEIEGRVPEIVAAYRKRLAERVSALLGEAEVDQARLAQEVAFFAEKSDVSEEIVRLKSHLAQFEDFLSAHGALGRRLEFLIQEMNREINTLGSKSPDPHVSGLVIEMKAELEKLREQVQNVE